MVEFSEMLVQFASVFIAILVFFIRNAIFLIQVSHNNFPQATAFVFALVAIYVLYKLVFRMMRMFMRLAVSLVKTFVLMIVITLGICVYLRGWRFITKDLLYFKKILFGFNQEKLSTMKNKGPIESLFEFFNFGGENEVKSYTGSILDEFGIDFAWPNDEVAKAMNPDNELNYENVHKFVHQQMDSFGDYIKSQNWD